MRERERGGRGGWAREDDEGEIERMRIRREEDGEKKMGRIRRERGGGGGRG